MLSLRTRFTALLIISVVLVLVIAAVVTAWLLRKPPEVMYDRVLAEKAEFALLLLRADPLAAQTLHIEIRDKPEKDRIDQERTDNILTEGRRQGYTADVVVLKSFNPHRWDIAVRLDDGRWAYLDFPEPGPFPYLPLAAYLGLVAIGMTGISIYASNVMMRPLRILDETIAMIRPDGIIPELPETGPVEVRTTAKTINRLATRLNAAVASRMRMIAAAGHDMRTPMTRMRLRAEFVSDGDDRQSWLKDLDELDHIADSAIRLVREEVSLAAQERVPLDVVLCAITDEAQETNLAVERGLVVPVLVKGSPFALKRALRNLVVNAATHGGGARVSLASYGTEAMLTIVDSGPGIPPNLLGRVFEPFFRVDQARRQLVAGAGLGLAISREIIENHGGTITIVNRREGGLLQTVRLPLCAADQD